MKRLLSVLTTFFMLAACSSGNADEQVLRGNAAYYSGDQDNALAAFQQAQVESPDTAVAYYNAGLAYMAESSYDEAVVAFEQALNTATGDLRSDIYLALGNAHAEIFQFGDAIDAYQAGLRIQPDDEDIRYNLEIALLRYIEPTATAQQQQVEPNEGQTDPEATPTENPGDFDDPTPTPPPFDFDPTQPPDSGQGPGSQDDSATPIPQSQGEMTVEQAEELLDRIRQNQEALREFLEEVGGEGDVSEKDW